MIKKILLSLALLSSLAFAKTLEMGDSIEPFSLKDQFDKTVEVNSNDYETIIFSAEKDPASWVTEYLKDKSNTYLQDNKTVFISDISGMPSLITQWFALPKMKKYNYSLALITQESDLFPKKEKALTIIKIQDNKISSIDFITQGDMVESIFK